MNQIALTLEPLSDRLREAGQLYLWLQPLLDEAADRIEQSERPRAPEATLCAEGHECGWTFDFQAKRVFCRQCKQEGK